LQLPAATTTEANQIEATDYLAQMTTETQEGDDRTTLSVRSDPNGNRKRLTNSFRKGTVAPDASKGILLARFGHIDWCAQQLGHVRRKITERF
jgi:hypothetical protein